MVDTGFKYAEAETKGEEKRNLSLIVPTPVQQQAEQQQQTEQTMYYNLEDLINNPDYWITQFIMGNATFNPSLLGFSEEFLHKTDIHLRYSLESPRTESFKAWYQALRLQPYWKKFGLHELESPLTPLSGGNITISGGHRISAADMRQGMTVDFYLKYYCDQAFYSLVKDSKLLFGHDIFKPVFIEETDEEGNVIKTRLAVEFINKDREVEFRSKFTESKNYRVQMVALLSLGPEVLTKMDNIAKKDHDVEHWWLLGSVEKMYNVARKAAEEHHKTNKNYDVETHVEAFRQQMVLLHRLYDMLDEKEWSFGNFESYLYNKDDKHHEEAVNLLVELIMNNDCNIKDEERLQTLIEEGIVVQDEKGNYKYNYVPLVNSLMIKEGLTEKEVKDQIESVCTHPYILVGILGAVGGQKAKEKAKEKKGGWKDVKSRLQEAGVSEERINEIGEMGIGVIGRDFSLLIKRDEYREFLMKGHDPKEKGYEGHKKKVDKIIETLEKTGSKCVYIPEFEFLGTVPWVTLDMLLYVDEEKSGIVTSTEDLVDICDYNINVDKNGNPVENVYAEINFGFAVDYELKSKEKKKSGTVPGYNTWFSYEIVGPDGKTIEVAGVWTGEDDENFTQKFNLSEWYREGGPGTYKVYATPTNNGYDRCRTGKRTLVATINLNKRYQTMEVPVPPVQAVVGEGSSKVFEAHPATYLPTVTEDIKGAMKELTIAYARGDTQGFINAVNALGNVHLEGTTFKDAWETGNTHGYTWSDVQEVLNDLNNGTITLDEAVERLFGEGGLLSDTIGYRLSSMICQYVPEKTIGGKFSFDLMASSEALKKWGEGIGINALLITIGGGATTYNKVVILTDEEFKEIADSMKDELHGAYGSVRADVVSHGGWNYSAMFFYRQVPVVESKEDELSLEVKMGSNYSVTLGALKKVTGWFGIDGWMIQFYRDEKGNWSPMFSGTIGVGSQYIRGYGMPMIWYDPDKKEISVRGGVGMFWRTRKGVETGIHLYSNDFKDPKKVSQAKIIFGGLPIPGVSNWKAGLELGHDFNTKSWSLEFSVSPRRVFRKKKSQETPLP